MSQSFTAQTLTIASGGTASNEFSVPQGIHLLEILAPATLAETVTLRKAQASGGTFRTVQDGGFDVVIAAGKAPQALVGGGVYNLTASGAVAASRTFVLHLNG